MATEETAKAASESLVRIQNFDPDSLTRKEDLGRLEFSDAVPGARRVIELFQRISPESLRHFPEGQATQVRNEADGAFNLFTKFLEFDPASAENAGEQRRVLLQQLEALPEQLATKLWQHIAFSVASSLDPTATQQQIRTVLQQFKDERARSIKEVGAVRTEAEEVLERVRTAAAEQGVSQKASYFKTIAEEHATDAEVWMWRSLWFGLATLAFAIISALTYRVPWLAPRDTIETVQLVSSKLFILGIIGYGTLICVRNFLSHKHNSVVNRHRQNALLTYTAFVDAAPSVASREIVLTHAAASVFSPQDTGYIKNEEPAGGRSVMEMITRSSMNEGKAS